MRVIARRLGSLFLLTSSGLMTSGCGGVTLGPTVKTEYVVVYPGEALQVLENKTVRARSLKTDLIGRQDIGGWVCMPREHFDILARKAGYEDK